MTAHVRGMTERTLGGLFWAFLGTGSQAVLQILVLVVLARLLTPIDFGIVAAAMVVIGFSAIFSHLGVGPALVQRRELTPAHIRVGFVISILLGFAFAGLIWLLAPALAVFFQVETLTPVLRVLAWVFPIQGLATVAESLLQRELRFRALAVADVVSVAVGYGAVGIVLAVLDWGVWALVAAHLGQNVLRTLLLLLMQPHAKAPLLERRACAELLYFGGGFAAGRVSNYIALQGDHLIVGRWLGALALGLYSRAYHLMTGPVVLLGQVLDKVLFPAMAHVQDRRDRLADAYRRGVALIAIVIIPGSAVACILAPELIYILLGPDWHEVTLPFQILATAMLFRTSYKMSDSLSRATGAVYRRALRQTAYAALVILGAWIGHFWGLAGVAVGVVAAVAGNFLLMAQLSLSLTGLTWRTFAAAHLPGLVLGTLIGLTTAGTAWLLRSVEISPFLVVLGSLAATLPCLLVVWRLPDLFIGRDGRWMLEQLSKQLMRRSRQAAAEIAAPAVPAQPANGKPPAVLHASTDSV